jgi:hypothetical protein
MTLSFQSFQNFIPGGPCCVSVMIYVDYGTYRSSISQEKRSYIAQDSHNMGLLEHESLGEIGLYPYEKSMSSVYGYVSILHL